ncbi:MAG: DUF2652 domain-containing protein [Candidatus Lambdaproteobacteria bacterium]|nr:DUF2652 domain-containing protein [Candidatus Lambdaproteobacteria bacterium]
MSTEYHHGLLLLPDISGFTEFVSAVEISHSQHVINNLLELLLSHNQLALELSEIEGDALFFYRRGDPPALAEFNGQIDVWINAFHARLKRLQRDTYCKCGACQSIGNLGLKVVGHWGEFALNVLHNKSQVVGRDVILVHRMLKNSLPLREYALLSHALLERLAAEPGGFAAHREAYEVLGEVGMGYVDLSHVRAQVPVPPHEPQPAPEASIAVEVALPARMEDLVALITDLAGWPTWIAGLESVTLDRTAPLHAGLRHDYAVLDREREVRIAQIRESADAFVLCDEIQPPFPLKRLRWQHQVTATPEGVIYRTALLYDRQPWLGRLFDLLAGRKLRALLAATAENLRRRFPGPAA